MESAVTIQKPDSWECPCHGESDSIMHVRVMFPAKPGQAYHEREVELTRNYCIRCYVEALDRIGVQDMKKKT